MAQTLFIWILVVIGSAASTLAVEATAAEPTETIDDSLIDMSVLMIADKGVQSELRCRAEQRRDIRKLLDTCDQQIWALRDVSLAEGRDRLVPLLDKLTQGLDPLLMPFQRERFKQLILQRQGPNALLTPDMIQALALSDQQIKQIQAVMEDTRIKLEELAKTPPQEKGPNQRKRESYKILSHQQKLLLVVLTEDQKKTWIKQRGREFKFDVMQPLPVRAPELRNADDPENWINSKPLTLIGLRGQVVIVHFWTFGCINCRRNYWAYKGWQRDYADRSLTIVGIHTPETASEHNVNKLRSNIKDNEITFPILIDNDKKNWDAWTNRVWPSVYLVDRAGYIRYWWYGELKGSTPDQNMEKWVRSRINLLLDEVDTSSLPAP